MSTRARRPGVVHDVGEQQDRGTDLLGGEAGIGEALVQPAAEQRGEENHQGDDAGAAFDRRAPGQQAEEGADRRARRRRGSEVPAAIRKRATRSDCRSSRARQPDCRRPTGLRSSRRPLCLLPSVFYRQRIERAPEVPGGDRAPRPPGLAQLAHPLQRDFPSLEVVDADPFCSPRSSSGNTSGRSRLNIRNISAVQRPMPRTSVSSAMIASSSICGQSLLVDLAVGEVLREVGDVLGLAVRKPAGAQLRPVLCNDRVRVIFCSRQMQPCSTRSAPP